MSSYLLGSPDQLSPTWSHEGPQELRSFHVLPAHKFIWGGERREDLAFPMANSGPHVESRSARVTAG